MKRTYLEKLEKYNLKRGLTIKRAGIIKMLVDSPVDLTSST